MLSSKNNRFTASDIERYHSGNMSPEERHALEKAALDDPFLADALEGYAFTSAPLDDLKKIQSSLDEKTGRKKVVPFFQKHKWLSVAAIVLILAGTGWFAYSISAKENNSVATAEKNEKPKEVSPKETIQPSNDTTHFTTTVADKKLDQKQQSQTLEQKTNSKQISIEPEKILHHQSKEVTTSKKEQPIFKSNPPSANQNEIVSNKSFFVTQQPDVKTKNEAVPGRMNEVMVMRRQNLNDTGVNNSVASSNSDIAKNDTIKNLNIVLHPLSMDSAQTLVLEQGAKRKSTERYPHVIIDTLEPAAGYVNFDDYVASNLKMPDEIKDKSSGEVQLSFDVDKNGQPTNITVIKSLCQKCDEEAIRLLKEGPKWKKKKNKKGKITFKF